jgi:MFS family permease
VKKNKKHNLQLLLLASYTNNFGWGVYSPLYAIYVLKLGGDAFQVSLLWSVYALMAGMLMIFFGWTENSRQFNSQKMLVIGYLLFVVIAVALLFAKNITHFYIVQTMLAIAMGVMTPAARSTYAKAQKKGKESGQWGLFDGGNYILMAASAFVGGILYKLGGFQYIFLCMLAIQLLAGLFAFIYYKRTQRF